VTYEGRLSRRWRRRPHKLNFGTVLLSLVVIFALAVALLGAAVVLVPNATVHLAPIAQPVSGSLEVTANPEYREIDYGQAIIPARVGRSSSVGGARPLLPGALMSPMAIRRARWYSSTRQPTPSWCPKGLWCAPARA